MQWLRNIPKPWVWTVFVLATVASGVLIHQLNGFEEELRQAGAPTVLGYELAFTDGAVREMLEAWSPEHEGTVTRALELDFWFIPAYAFALASLLLLVAGAHRGLLRQIGLDLVAAPLMAGLLDVLENLLLLSMLDGGDLAYRPAVASGAASVKFFLVAVAIIYLLVCLGRFLYREGKGLYRRFLTPGLAAMAAPGEQPAEPTAFLHAYPRELRRREVAAVAVRRGKRDPDLEGTAGTEDAEEVESEGAQAGGSEDPRRLPEDTVGVALSGGGIRSATFSLGLFQSLAARRLLGRVDFLSTVSGGGYFGSFLGRLFHRDLGGTGSGEGTPDRVSKVEDVLGAVPPAERPDDGGSVLGFLRENGRYLAPNGGGDVLLAASMVVRNLVAVHAIFFLSVLSVFLAGRGVRSLVERLWGGLPALMADLSGAEPSIWWSPWVLPVPLLLALAALPLGWAYWYVDHPREAWRRPFQGGSLVVVLVLGILVSGYFGANAGQWLLVGAYLVLLAAITWWVWRVCAWRRRPESSEDGVSEEERILGLEQVQRNRLSRALTRVLFVTVAILLCSLVDSLGQTAYLAIQAGDLVWEAWLGGILTSLVAIGSAAQRVVLMLRTKDGEDRGPGMSLRLGATVVALVLGFALLVTGATLAHGIAWGFGDPTAAEAGDRPVERTEALRATLLEDGDASVDVVLERSAPPVLAIPEEPPPYLPLIFGLGAVLGLTLLFGQSYPFLNRSSHHTVYGDRLARAYLGASNRERWGGGTGLTVSAQTDDLPLEEYRPFCHGGPVHLINTTVNETVDGRSQVQQQDRKGTGMAVGPFGLSVGVKHHLVFDGWKRRRVRGIFPEQPWRVFEPYWPPEGGGGLGGDDESIPVCAGEETESAACPPSASEGPGSEPSEDTSGEKASGKDTSGEAAGTEDSGEPFEGEVLSLGQWTAISGAAFSTGTGYRTSLGLSLLAGLANVRLGYWWDMGRNRPGHPFRFWDKVFPVQTYLARELVARFPGTARRRWYVSDGGHFENLAGYELLRRRLPKMILVDAAADPEYRLEDLARLVRKARIDFGAEIEFLTDEDLDGVVRPEIRPYLGSLERLRRGRWSTTPTNDPDHPERLRVEEVDLEELSLAHAALARVTYEDDGPEAPTRWLLYVKPTLCGGEPLDVLEYHGQHSAFPQETTADQFFDEAQWESYRKLGEHIGSVLFQELEPEHGTRRVWTPREMLGARART